jgi:predicted transcriptional regulator
MDRQALANWLEQGLSLTEIGALIDRDPSIVGYWVKERGLAANGRDKHAPRGALTREQLEPLVERGMTVAAIADGLGRNPAAVRYWLDKLGIKTKSRRGPRPMVSRAVVEHAIKEGARTVVGHCRHHGEGVFVIENSGRVRCRQCRMDRVNARRRKVKRMLIEEAGGRCAICGYDRFVGALHFHHLDPSIKRFAVSRNGATIGIDVLRAEASKCVVLCANCHAEVEHGLTELPLK